MKSIVKTVCIAAGIAGVFFIGGAAAVLIMEHCRNGRDCCPAPCDDGEDLTPEDCVDPDGTFTEEADHDEY